LKLTQKIKNIFKPEVKSAESLSYQQLANLLQLNSFDNNEDYYRSYAYSCINARAEKLAMAKVLLYKRQGKETIEVEDENELAKWFLTSNNTAEQSLTDLLYLTSANEDLSGRCMFVINRGIKDIPIEFQFVSGTQIIQTWVNQFGVIAKVQYQNILGSISEVNYGDFIFFYLPNPSSPLKHKATVTALKYQLDIDLFQSKHQSKFYKNNARIDGLLTTDQNLNKDTFDKLKDDWNKNYTGELNPGKTAFIHSGLKYQSTGSTAKEMDYVESRKAIRDEIYSILRVPKVALGVTEDVNKSSAYISMLSFMKNTIIPFARPIEQKLNSFIKNNFGKEYSVKFDYSLEEDPQVVLSTNKLLIDSGAITLNELRTANNYGISDNPLCNEHIIRQIKTENNNTDNGTQ
jgi:HK97 family phage portal protein